MSVINFGSSKIMFTDLLRKKRLLPFIFSSCLLVIASLFILSASACAEQNFDARLKDIDNQLKTIEVSQSQVKASQEGMIEKIKTLKIWARRKGGGGGS